jgi:PKD repeat protein
MKHLYTTLILLIATTLSQAQTHPSQPPATLYSVDKMEMRSSTAGIDTCSADTVRYVRDGKATGFIGVTMNFPSEFAGYSQYYDAPQEITVSGMCFYAGVVSSNPLDTAIVKCRVYAANPDSTLGAVLTEKDITVYNNYFPSNIDLMRYCIEFDSIVVTNQAYYVSVWTETTLDLGIITDDFNSNDGQNEGLGWWYWTGDSTWYVSDEFFAWDVDFLIEPIASYVLEDSISLTLDSTCAGTIFCAERFASPIVYNRMYSQDALAGNDSIPFMYDWGDSTLSYENDSCHLYSAEGLYTISLTTSINGWTSICSAIATATHTVTEIPTAAFTSPANQLDVSFTDVSTGSPTSWLWDFGDGNSDTSQNATHTYGADGTYWVCLTTTNACGSTAVCDSVTVCTNPVASFTWVAGGQSGDVTFTGTSSNSTSWSWDFGDGSGTSTDQDPVYYYTAIGYNWWSVCLTATNGCSSDTYCDSVQSIISGIEDEFLSNAISIYPNPTEDNVNITFDLDKNTKLSLQVVSITGAVVREMNLGEVSRQTISLDLSDLAQGVYYVRFSAPEGQAIKEIIKLK